MIKSIGMACGIGLILSMGAQAWTNDLPDAVGGTILVTSNGTVDMTSLKLMVASPQDTHDAVDLASLQAVASNAASTSQVATIMSWASSLFATSGQVAALSMLITTGSPPNIYTNLILTLSQASNITVNTTGTNYQAVDPTVNGHLQGIDAALASIGSSISGLGGSMLATLTNVTVVQTNVYGSIVSNRTAVMLIRTNGASPDTWSQYPARTNIDAAGYQISNVSTLTMTGRIVVGFGVFSSSNDVPAPPSSNIWYVYAARVGTTNCLMGIDYQAKRTFIGVHP